MGRTTEEFYDSSIRDIIKQIRIHIKIQKEKYGNNGNGKNNKNNENGGIVKGKKETYMRIVDDE